MVEMDTKVVCGGVEVRSGDVIFGDIDGVIVIPREVEDKVIAAAIEKVSAENHTRRELENGALLSDVYAKYGVL